jgi:SAM-dependent methyltransferase
MIQDEVFRLREGDCWFNRNQHALVNKEKIDYPFYMLNLLRDKDKVKSVLELGCADGWRLNKLRKVFNQDCKFFGVDASDQAIQAGLKQYPDLKLALGVLSSVPFKKSYDIVIVNFVLHWIDRSTLAKSIAEIDRLTRDGGFLVIGDFFPDYPQRRFYHHCPDDSVYTYKQDYTKIFESLGTYKQIANLTYDHDCTQTPLQPCESQSRAFCAILEKSLSGFYHEVI